MVTLFKGLSDLQLGDEKGTLNHLVKQIQQTTVNCSKPSIFCEIPAFVKVFFGVSFGKFGYTF